MALFMRNKMITLCPTTYETAKKMPNFSSWVRMKLLEYNQTPIKLTTQPAPVSKNYMCKHCLAIEDHWSHNCPMIEVIE